MITLPTLIAALSSSALLVPIATPVAAIGWSILYMILGGGLIGAIVIFIVAKALGK